MRLFVLNVPDREHLIAFFYDLLSTTYYEELSKKMAMKLGGEYHTDRIGMLNFEKFASEVGFTQAAVRDRIFDIAETTLSVLDSQKKHNDVSLKIASMIEGRCKRLLN